MKQFVTAMMWCAFIPAFTLNVFGQSAPMGDPVAAIPTQEDWQAYAENPCVSFGQERSMASWNDPCVLKQDGRYVMYLTSSAKMPGQPPVQPYRAVSVDGFHWTLEPKQPLLAPGTNVEDFDFQNVETPSVVFFQGRYHMYYTGVQKGLSGPMAIGHATSSDGIRWTKDAGGPVVRPSGNRADFNGLQVAEPAAVVRGNELWLYYAAVGLRGGGSPPAKRVIALATSDDGAHFGMSQVVLEQSALYPTELGFDGYSTPSAVLHEGKMHLFYDVGYFNRDASRKWCQVALHHAASDDGETNWIQDSKAIFTRGSFDWTSLEIRAPTALFEKDVLRLWFAGNANVEEFLPDVRQTGKTRMFGIGSATKSH